MSFKSEKALSNHVKDSTNHHAHLNQLAVQYLFSLLRASQAPASTILALALSIHVYFSINPVWLLNFVFFGFMILSQQYLRSDAIVMPVNCRISSLTYL